MSADQTRLSKEALRAKTPRDQRKRVVALTGANSFLGRGLTGLMENDESISKIVLLDIEVPSNIRAKTCFYKTDLTRPYVDSRIAEILNAERVELFVHLAFRASPNHRWELSHELESVGTMYVLNACNEYGIQKFVHCSTTLTYGPHPSNPNYLTEAHPIRGMSDSPFISDKIEAEKQVQRFAEHCPDSIVTILRLAPILGPSVENYVAKWLSRRFVPTVMGFDPLVQFVHEIDAVAALKLAVDRDMSGIFNIVGDGVLPISMVVKLAGRFAIPIPYRLLKRISSWLWDAQVSESAPEFVDLLRYLCVVDGNHAQKKLGFMPAYSSRDTVLDFEGALRLREANLLHEANA